MTDISFSLNLIADMHTILQYDFMQHAFEAGTIVAIIVGIVGYFVVSDVHRLRRTPFLTLALRERPVPFFLVSIL